MSQACLRDYRLLRCHRRGHMGSDPIPDVFSIADQASDALALLQHLGEGRSNVVGHSYGGAVALQMALDAPDVVGSLILIEPAIYHCVWPHLGEPMARAIAKHADSYRSGDPEAAVDGFMIGAGGKNWRADADSAIPGSSAQAIRDAATFFEVENVAHAPERSSPS